MIAFFQALAETVFSFFDFIYAYITNGIYSMAVWFYSKFIEYLIISYLDFVLWAVPFALDVAKQILDDFNISNLLVNAFSGLDSNIKAFLVNLRIFEAVNLVLSGAMAKFVCRFIPFI